MITKMRHFVFIMHFFWFPSFCQSNDPNTTRPLNDINVPLNLQEAILRLNKQTNILNSLLESYVNFNAPNHVMTIADKLEEAIELNFQKPNISQACLSQFMYFSRQLRSKQSRWAIES
jgi:hypothetical protein